MTNKLKSYDRATEKLMSLALDMDVPVSKNGFALSEMVHLLRESFKYKLTYKRVFDELRPANCDPSTGFCLVSSYYIYENTGGDAQWTLMKSPLHWWLEHKRYGVFDITYTQFGDKFPYSLYGTVEDRINKNNGFLELLQTKAHILGKCAGLEV